MSRRRVGIAALQQREQTQDQFRKVGSELSAQEVEKMQQQLTTFKENLEVFASKHKREILANPELRQHFQTMCSSIGVDPLASNKGFWAEVLGVGDFYYEVAVQVVEICLRTRASNGGLIYVREMRDRLQAIRKQKLSEDDIERAVQTMQVLGSGFKILLVGHEKIIQSVPLELTTDHTTVIDIGQTTGWVNASLLSQKLGWADARILSILKMLSKESIVWLDTQDPEGVKYWFPSMLNGTLLDEATE